MKLLFTSHNGFVSKIIRKFTWHWASHVAITDHYDMVWECNHMDGCVMMPYEQWRSEHENHQVEEIRIDVDKIEVVKRLNSDLGVDYDFYNLVGHLFRTDGDNHSQHTCTSYVAKAINYDKAFFSHDLYHRIAPRHLWLAAYAHHQAITG